MEIGVLALQGDFDDHILALQALGVKATEVRLPKQLLGLNGLIIPGGESTVIGKLATEFGLIDALREFGQLHAIWGTCAGAILMSKNTDNPQPLLQLMDMQVERNAYGRQIDSFEELLHIQCLAKMGGENLSYRAVFIRAPRIHSVGSKVNVLARSAKGEIVAAQQGHFLATTFHPEITNDLRLHQYFLALTHITKT